MGKIPHFGTWECASGSEGEWEEPSFAQARVSCVIGSFQSARESPLLYERNERGKVRHLRQDSVVASRSRCRLTLRYHGVPRMPIKGIPTGIFTV
jgi:hypothetical protein